MFSGQSIELPLPKRERIVQEHDDTSDETTTSCGRARRRFIKAATFAAAATWSTMTAAEQNKDRAAPDVPSKGCPDLNVPMKDVEGKVAFITGGSSGIGLGIARAFADAGMKIVIGYRTLKHLEYAMTYLKDAGRRVHAIDINVTDRSGMERAAKETVEVFGKVHVLVNNAGIAHPARLRNTTYDDWDWTMAVNLNGVFNGVHAFLPSIEAHGEGGQIVTTSSVLGLFAASGDLAAYTVSKFAVVGLMEVLRAELLDSNIGASVFCPGMVKSNITESQRNRPSDLADTSSRPDSAAIAGERLLRAKFDMDPLEAGKIVLRGMRNNDLYILTDSGADLIVRDRNEALTASIQAASSFNATRTGTDGGASRPSIYALERTRRRCASMQRTKSG